MYVLVRTVFDGRARAGIESMFMEHGEKKKKRRKLDQKTRRRMNEEKRRKEEKKRRKKRKNITSDVPSKEGTNEKDTRHR